MIQANIIKLTVGFFLGFILIYFIQDFHWIWINIIQFLFFLGLYSVIDIIIKKRYEKKNDR